MGLLDKLEKKMAKHPLADESYNIKIDYLYAVIFFIAIDDNITDSEKEYFNTIVHLLDCDDAKDDLHEFMENPNLDEFENIFKLINEKDYSITYFLEVFYLLENKSLNESENKFIDIVANILNYKKEEINIIFDFVSHVKNSNDNEAISSFQKIQGNNLLLQKIDKFATFYKLNSSMKSKFTKETTGNISDKVIIFEDNIPAWIDSDTGLMWEVKTKENIGHQYVWEDALSYAQKLNANNHAGFSNWRVPTLEELKTLVTKERNNDYYIKYHLSKNNKFYYWSSATNAYYTGSAWSLDFRNGYTNYDYKVGSLYVRCVRGGQ